MHAAELFYYWMQDSDTFLNPAYHIVSADFFNLRKRMRK